MIVATDIPALGLTVGLIIAIAILIALMRHLS